MTDEEIMSEIHSRSGCIHHDAMKLFACHNIIDARAILEDIKHNVDRLCDIIH